MTFPRPEVDLRRAPEAFDELTEWLDRWSTGLVLLEEYPLETVRSAIRAVERAVRSHRERFDPWVRGVPASSEEVGRAVRIILSDHEWFETSLAQFWWFFGVVEGEDHGGHRQALGQFGRVLAEALRRHRADERKLDVGVRGFAPAPSPSSRQP